MPLSNDKSSERDQHSKYVELCALLTTGTLSTEDLDDLNVHLETCSDCRTLVADFQHIVRDAVPLLAPGREGQTRENAFWQEEKSKRRLFSAIEDQERKGRQPENHIAAAVDLPVFRYVGTFALLILVAVAGYVLGSRRYLQTSVQVVPAQTQSENAVALRIADLTKQRDALDAKAAAASKAIDHFATQAAQQSRDLLRLKQLVEDSEAGKSQQSAEISTLRDENASMHKERDNLAQQLKDAQVSLSSLNQDVSRLQAERVADLLQATNMQKTIEDLTAQVNSRESTVAEQRKFLDSDRDIRELMGARDLYVADVFDVDQDGHSRKPFGRVFYTKNKSLVFYAFDLDKQPGVRDVRTFQAWGQNSSDKASPVNMGIFYMDNEANRRWVLKFDNPKVMEQIDAVFVTVEPKGGSEKPRGKQLMYAYLRTTPNHP
jgi:hypothetical protein